MTGQELDILIHKQLTGQASPEEVAQFHAWLNGNEANAGYFQKMAEIWAAAETLDFTVQPQTDAEWEKTRQKINAGLPVAKPQARVIRISTVWRLAAAAALVLGVTLWWLFGKAGAGLAEPLQFAAASGKIENVTLPDGSLVTLNAGSTLEATKGFGGKERRVKLSGEAFFQVTSNAGKPFFVDAESAGIRVVGTAFNVRAYPGSQSVTASVTEGKVEFFTSDQNKVQLTPGTEGILEKNTGKISTRQVEAAGIAAWRQGKLVFDNMPLVEALAVLGRHFGVSVKIEGDISGKRLFSTFENESLEEILKTLELTYDLNFTVQKDTILVQDR